MPKAHEKFFGIVAEARPVDDEARCYGVSKKSDRLFGEEEAQRNDELFRRKMISAVRADEAQRSKSIGASSRYGFWEPQEDFLQEK